MKKTNRYFVIGAGNPMRGDDGIAHVMIDRLRKTFPFLRCEKVFGPDIDIIHDIAQYEEILILDAMTGQEEVPFQFLKIEPAESCLPRRGYTSHLFNWEHILSFALDVYGKAPECRLMAISACHFDFREDISTACLNNAEKAYQWLLNDYFRFTVPGFQLL